MDFWMSNIAIVISTCHIQDGNSLECVELLLTSDIYNPQTRYLDNFSNIPARSKRDTLTLEGLRAASDAEHKLALCKPVVGGEVVGELGQVAAEGCDVARRGDEAVDVHLAV